MNELRLTEAEIKVRAFEYVAVELSNLTYESHDVERLCREDVHKLVDEVARISNWFWRHKEELMKTI